MDFRIHKAVGGFIIDWGKGEMFQVVTSFDMLTETMRKRLYPEIPSWMGSVQQGLQFVDETDKCHTICQASL